MHILNHNCPEYCLSLAAIVIALRLIDNAKEPKVKAKQIKYLAPEANGKAAYNYPR